MKPILKSKNPEFILRHIVMKDLREYFECFQDEEARKGFMKVPRNLAEARKELSKKILEMKKKKSSREIFSIEVDEKFAGYVEINHLNEEHHEHRGNVGYCIHPKFRGRGLASEALKVLLKYAIKKYKLKRIEGWCRTFNKASVRTLEKSGFKLEGILRKNKLRNGKYLDDMCWAVVR